MLANQIHASWRDRTVRINGVELHVVEAGPPDGPLVVMLHGFPEFWYAWRHYLDILAGAGYRVIVPDQRGYNLSGQPSGVAQYELDKLAGDVIGLIDAAGRRRAVLVGHDWGGCVAWWAAAHYPARIERLAVLNCPHPRAMIAAVLTNPRQLVKSWYILLFQIPWLPERILRARSFALLRWIMHWDGDDGSMSPDEEAWHIQAWSRGRALTTMINWYRALVRTLPLGSGGARISVPTLLIWGERDPYLGRSLAEASLKYCDAGRVAWVPGATHWVHHERRAVVAEHILEFLTARADREVHEQAGN